MRACSAAARSSSSAESSSHPVGIRKLKRVRHMEATAARVKENVKAVAANVCRVTDGHRPHFVPDHASSAASETTSASIGASHVDRLESSISPPDTPTFARVDSDIRERIISLSAQLVLSATSDQSERNGALVNALVFQLACVTEELRRRQVSRLRDAVQVAALLRLRTAKGMEHLDALRQTATQPAVPAADVASTD